MNHDFEVATMAVIPPNFLLGLGCIVSRSAVVALVVPLSSHLWIQRLERVAFASLPSHTAWASLSATQHASVHGGHSRSPFVGLTDRAHVADPVGCLATAASQLARIQSHLLIQSPIPELQHVMLTFCQCGMAFFTAAVSDICAIWTSCAKTSAVVNGCLPFTATFTPPPSLLTATDCELVRAALVCVAPLRNQVRCLCGQGVVLANLPVCTEGTPSALLALSARPVVNCCKPAVLKATWTLVTGPPEHSTGLGLDDNIAKMSIFKMVKLALQKRAQEADVWSCLTVVGKSYGGEQSELRQAALYWEMFANVWAVA